MRPIAAGWLPLLLQAESFGKAWMGAARQSGRARRAATGRAWLAPHAGGALVGYRRLRRRSRPDARGQSSIASPSGPPQVRPRVRELHGSLARPEGDADGIAARSQWPGPEAHLPALDRDQYG